MADGASLKGELVGEVELKSGPDRFFKLWKSEAHKAPNHASSRLQSVEVHEGDWETPGSIKTWNYTTLDGKKEVFKEKIEVDEEKKMVKLIGVDGDVFKSFKEYSVTWHIVPKGEGHIAKIIVEFEKLNPDIPAPQHYLDFIVSFTNDIDAGLVEA